MDDQTPKWNRDLPLDALKDDYVTRREFTKFLILLSGGTFLGNAWLLVDSMLRRQPDYPSILVAHVSAVRVGTAKLFHYPTEDDLAILIRLADDKWVAYAQRCTHLSCPVLYARERSELQCPCHDGAFDAATGRVLRGPPPRPLPRIALRIDDNRVYAYGLMPG